MAKSGQLGNFTQSGMFAGGMAVPGTAAAVAFSGITGVPTDNAALSTSLNTKVDKTASLSQVYTTNGAGAQTTTAYSPAATASTIVQRDLNGNAVFNSLSNSIATVTAATVNLVASSPGTTLADATGAAMTVNLPAAALMTGQYLSFKKIDVSANTVTIDANAAELIDGATTKVLTTQYQSIMMQSNGTAWWII